MASNPAASDPDLQLAQRVRAAQRGEDAAFTELVREAYPAVLHHALRLLRDPSEAQDCAQETFAEAFATLGVLAEPQRLEAALLQRDGERVGAQAGRPDHGAVPELHAAPDFGDE